MAQYYCRAEKLFEVYPESFYPPPKVVSAIVRLVPHEHPPVDAEPAALGQVVATAFSQRRKTLRNSLKSLFDEAALQEAGIEPSARAGNAQPGAIRPACKNVAGIGPLTFCYEPPLSAAAINRRFEIIFEANCLFPLSALAYRERALSGGLPLGTARWS